MIIGIVGGGQLARMLALAGYPLGLRFLVLDPAPDACAGQIADLVQGSYDDPDKLAELAERADVVTFDFENVPAEAAHALAERVPIYPAPTALDTAQDRFSEKTLFQRLGIPTPLFEPVDSVEDLHQAVNRVGLPAVLKTRRLGYDGKGQRILRVPGDIEPAWRDLGRVALILERFVPFQREVSMLAARGRDGDAVFYSLVENRHKEGILHLSRAPCVMESLENQVRDYTVRVLESLDYVGLLAIEFFVLDERVLINEMAPRVHNSGHWTIEGAETSQFENHLRAILGLPLGATANRGHTAMINFIGQLPEQTVYLNMPGAHYHAYGKSPRRGRKVGHVTLRADDLETLESRLDQLLPELE